jgi:hypothetical protein
MESRKNRLVNILAGMLKQAEWNNVNKVDFHKKFLYITELFEFIYNNDMMKIINTKLYQDSVKTKLNEITLVVQTREIPYWLAVKYNTVSTALLKQISESENK